LAAQGVHAELPVPDAKVPAGQAAHADDVTGFARNCPCGQGVHVATVGFGYVPGAQ
jgi:hypothetical protein